MVQRDFTIVIEQDDDSGFVARCLDLKGVYGQGNTEKEALEDITSAIDAAIAVYTEKNMPIPYKRVFQVKKDLPTASAST